MRGYKGYYIYIVYSNWDGGYYAEISDSQGKSIDHDDGVFEDRFNCIACAKSYIDCLNIKDD